MDNLAYKRGMGPTPVICTTLNDGNLSSKGQHPAWTGKQAKPVLDPAKFTVWPEEAS